MAIKEMISRTGRFFGVGDTKAYQPLRNVRNAEFVENNSEPTGIVEAPKTDEKLEAIQLLESSFNNLSDKLTGINDNLSRQLNQNNELIQRMDELPRILRSFPDSLSTQREVVEQLIDQLKMQSLKSDEFSGVIEKIPAAATKQTDAIIDMANQITASAAVDAQMNQRFGKFNELLDNLKDNVEGHTDSMIQMSKTYTASDRYLKYILNTQHKRFMWVFISALGICTFAIIALLITILVIS